jgi:shikimate kinase
MRDMKDGGNIFLVGMMGAGKSTVGRWLARRLKLRFFDSDHEIERRCGVRIPVVFEIEGEAGFRDREAQVIAELAALDQIVLATGGGVVLLPKNRQLLAARGFVVYLRARPEDLYERVRHDRNRPLLTTADPLARLRELYLERDPLYQSVADLVMETGAQGVQALARRLLDKLELRWKASA